MRETRLLLPQSPSCWRQPSQRTSHYATENQTCFRLTARLNDGHIVWRGWFDDRDDADAFLYAMASGSLRYERELWRLPTPWWPDLDDNISYDFSSVTFLTTPTGSNQTYNVPNDWNNGPSNAVETVGAGGGGAGGGGAGQVNIAGGGGGGGAYSGITGITLTPGGTATYQIGTGGLGGGVGGNGGSGGDSWFNATTLAASSVGAKAGTLGVFSGGGGTGGEQAGNTGGVGTVKNKGGNGSAFFATDNGGGGGGAAGSHGDGASVVNSITGGTADAGAGGLGGGGGSPGGNGQEWDATHGSGGGGGGNGNGSGTGGFYGGGGGGGIYINFVGATGAQGIVVVTYDPLTASLIKVIEALRLPRISMVGY